jgi:hypothetical protein
MNNSHHIMVKLHIVFMQVSLKSDFKHFKHKNKDI